MTPIHWACLSKIARAILRIAYGFKLRGQTMFMKARTIAGMLGCSRVTVARWLAVFESRGWFRRKKRHAHFVEYDVSQVSVTPPVTSADTSLPGSSLMNCVVEKRPAQNETSLQRMIRLAVEQTIAEAS